jgi:hypothetical protein
VTPLYFEALHSYRAVHDGRTFDWREGDLMEVTLHDLVWLMRDSPGLVDPAAPLSPDEVATLVAARQQRDQEEQVRAQKRDAAIRAHLRAEAGGPPMCRLRDGQWHLLDDIDAFEDGAGGWLVGCPDHLSRLSPAYARRRNGGDAMHSGNMWGEQ